MAKAQDKPAKTRDEIIAEIRSRDPVIRVDSVSLKGAAYEAMIAEWADKHIAEKLAEKEVADRLTALEATLLEKTGLTSDDLRLLVEQGGKKS